MPNLHPYLARWDNQGSGRFSCITGPFERDLHRTTAPDRRRNPAELHFPPTVPFDQYRTTHRPHRCPGFQFPTISVLWPRSRPCHAAGGNESKASFLPFSEEVSELRKVKPPCNLLTEGRGSGGSVAPRIRFEADSQPSKFASYINSELNGSFWNSKRSIFASIPPTTTNYSL